jgi:signal transduction histidine kinase
MTPALLEPTPLTAEEIDALNDSAWNIRKGDLQNRLAFAERALEAATAIDYRRGRAYAHRNRGALLKLVGRASASLADLNESANIFRELADLPGLASTYTQLGIAYQDAGDLHLAVENILNARATFERAGDTAGVARSLTNIGNLYLRLEQYNEAVQFYSESLHLHQSLGQERGIARARCNLGLTYLRLGDLTEAERNTRAGLITLEKQGLELDRCSASITLGEIAMERKEWDAAQAFFDEAWHLAEKNDFKRGQCALTNDFGALALRLGDLDTARTWYERAYDMSVNLSHRDLKLRALEGLIEISEADRDFKRALEFQKEYSREKSDALRAQSASIFRIREVIRQQEMTEHERRWREAKQLELENANLQLAAMNEHKDEILRIVGHDVRTPLSTIIGAGNLLRTEDAHSLEDVAKIGALIEDSGNRLLSLVNDLMDLARAQSSDFTLSLAPIDLRPIVQKTAAIFEPAAKRKEIMLTLESAPKLPPVLADALKVNQIIGNLLSNAIKFTARGGMVFVNVSEMPDGFVRITVRDTGIGVPSSQLASIFEKFGGHQRPGTDGELGTGLGMPIVKRFVELHHGRIGMESREGVGTKIMIDLPVAH